jgi:hypothetical protein
MHILAAVAGFAILLIILGDAFEAIVLPRRVTRRLRYTRLFYQRTWRPWRKVAGVIRTPRRRETLLSIFGPLSLILLLLSWALWLILAFALLQWAGGPRLSNEMPRGFGEALYFSGTTFTTLGLGDVKPTTATARFLTVWEGGTGFGFLALVIGYLPVIYQAFSRRETQISLLDARAGSPPSAVELLRRHVEARSLNQIEPLLHDFERWSAEILESHISYPVLAYFRSQHANESWVGALTIILDVSSLLIVGIDGIRCPQAQLTFAMARHITVDLAQVLQAPPLLGKDDRLPPVELARLQQVLGGIGLPLSVRPDAVNELTELRRMYEPYLIALARHLVLDVPGWFPRPGAPDNWQTSAWEHAARRIPPADSAVPDDHL